MIASPRIPSSLLGLADHRVADNAIATHPLVRLCLAAEAIERSPTRSDESSGDAPMAPTCPQASGPAAVPTKPTNRARDSRTILQPVQRTDRRATPSTPADGGWGTPRDRPAEFAATHDDIEGVISHVNVGQVGPLCDLTRISISFRATRARRHSGLGTLMRRQHRLPCRPLYTTGSSFARLRHNMGGLTGRGGPGHEVREVLMVAIGDWSVDLRGVLSARIVRTMRGSSTTLWRGRARRRGGIATRRPDAKVMPHAANHAQIQDPPGHGSQTPTCTMWDRSRSMSTC